ncbi:Acyl-CoA N-acyltransferase [Sulfurimonas gotlandica GD1]|uniref:Acyl-CoA N-acyltransferase n=2 Tax=Sulfurimonas TaxID=202746 RepID=B6BGL7_SULGG|nr:GCN5-related N-acetyltransferase [Sulfurimonas gotlandica GD1]EHP29645.1 Acyl-CoA N-acyltransferase [Sulfurimonas gotlandica GD1]
MLRYSMRLDELNKSLQDFPELNIYDRFYGLSSKDLGLYSLVENKIAGAIWIRLLKAEDGALGYLDASTPVLNIAVIPEFRSKKIGSAMLAQLLLEAGAVFERISASVTQNSNAQKLFEKFGFIKVDGSDAKSPVDGSDVFTMLKTLEKKEVVRPTDGYDPRRWMD